MWEVIKDFIFSCIEFFYNFCGDWGLAIIIVTVIFRLIMAPIEDPRDSEEVRG